MKLKFHWSYTRGEGDVNARDAAELLEIAATDSVAVLDFLMDVQGDLHRLYQQAYNIQQQRYAKLLLADKEPSET